MRVVKEVNVGGRLFKLHLDMEDATSQPAIFKTGKWEPKITSFLLKNLKQGMIFIDVGAAIGWFTIIGSSLVGEGGKVIAFEPSPIRFRTLVENVKMNTDGNVECIDKAVSSENGEAYISGEDCPMYLARSRNRFKINVLIDVVTLDSFLNVRGVEKVDIVKIDVEGSELRVLKGMEQTIRNSGEIKIICEVHIPYLSRYGDSVDRLFEYMHELGLRKRRLTGGRTALVPRYLFYKEEKR